MLTASRRRGRCRDGQGETIDPACGNVSFRSGLDETQVCDLYNAGLNRCFPQTSGRCKLPVNGKPDNNSVPPKRYPRFPPFAARLLDLELPESGLGSGKVELLHASVAAAEGVAYYVSLRRPEAPAVDWWRASRKKPGGIARIVVVVGRGDIEGRLRRLEERWLGAARLRRREALREGDADHARSLIALLRIRYLLPDMSAEELVDRILSWRPVPVRTQVEREVGLAIHRREPGTEHMECPPRGARTSPRASSCARGTRPSPTRCSPKGTRAWGGSGR
jgi:hypothetical protein